MNKQTPRRVKFMLLTLTLTLIEHKNNYEADQNIASILFNTKFMTPVFLLCSDMMSRIL